MATHKEIAWSYFQLLNEKQIEKALSLLDDQGSFWNLRTRAKTPVPQQKEYIRTSTAHLPVQFTLHNSFEEGDYVLLEISSHAELDDGYVYDNLYSFVILMREGKILELREYMDTRNAQGIADHLAQA
jgi:ketosteroid isomerase-like protein